MNECFNVSMFLPTLVSSFFLCVCVCVFGPPREEEEEEEERVGKKVMNLTSISVP